MLRKSLFSLAAGTVFAMLLGFSTSALAGCQGYCADRTVDGGTYAGCQMFYDANDHLTSVQCAYTKVTIRDVDMAAEGGNS